MITVRPAAPADWPACFAIRHEVFVVGQNVPLALEQDGQDGVAAHVVALAGAEPIGTARLREVDGHAKVERVAVLAAWRGHHAGVALMDALEAIARERGLTDAILYAQVAVVGFYTRLGWTAVGPEFVEADIPHQKMVKTL